VEKFKYFRLEFTRAEEQNKEIDSSICKANAVPREVYRSVLTKRELSNIAKLSVFKSVFVPIFTYGYVSYVMTERRLSQLQAAKIGFLRKVHSVALRDKVHSCKIECQAPSPNREIPAIRCFGHVIKMSQERMSRKVLLVTSTGKRPRGRRKTRWINHISEHCLVPSCCEDSRTIWDCWKSWGISRLVHRNVIPMGWDITHSYFPWDSSHVIATSLRQS